MVLCSSCITLQVSLFQTTMSHNIVETLLRNDAFRYLSICSFLFASSIYSLIPRRPQFNVVQALWSVQLQKQKNQHCFGSKGKTVTKTLQNRILLPSVLSKHFCCPLQVSLNSTQFNFLNVSVCLFFCLCQDVWQPDCVCKIPCVLLA